MALAKEMGVKPLLIKLPRMDRLESLQDWRTQIAWLYRRAVRGEMPEYLATKLTYIATAGANFAKAAAEQKALEEIQQQLLRLQGGSPVIARQPGDNELVPMEAQERD